MAGLHQVPQNGWVKAVFTSSPNAVTSGAQWTVQAWNGNPAYTRTAFLLNGQQPTVTINAQPTSIDLNVDPTRVNKVR